MLVDGLDGGGGLELSPHPSPRKQMFESQSRRRNKASMRAWAAGTLLLLLAVAASVASAQDILQNNNFIQDHDAAHKFGCGCMEYWTCVMRCPAITSWFLLELCRIHSLRIVIPIPWQISTNYVELESELEFKRNQKKNCSLIYNSSFQAEELQVTIPDFEKSTQLYTEAKVDVTQEIEQRAQWSAPAWTACCALCSISCVTSTLASV